MKRLNLFSPRSGTSRSQTSLQQSVRTIAQGIILSGLLWGAMSTVALAQFSANADRTDESDKCEWLGVCDVSGADSLHLQNSEDCSWLGVCEE